jgi:predicted transcriptional regulator
VSRLSSEGPLSISRLAGGHGITRQAITKHLRVMERAGLVPGAAQGRERIWHLEHKRLADARRHLDLISAEWDATLDRLKRFVE